MTVEIPEIDIGPLLRGDAESSHVVESLTHALKEVGFFYVTGYESHKEIATKLLEVGKTLFDLPDDVKNAISVKESKVYRGYVPKGADVTCNQADVKEGIYFGHEAEEGKEEEEELMRGFNRYPPNECVPGLSDTVNQYMAQMTSFGNALLKAMAVSLEQKDEFFQEMFKAPFPLLALWRYPPHPVDSGAWGIGPHTDYGVFTFVLQDDVGGLQIQAKDGTWVDAPNRPGTLAVLIGDVVEIWTRGLYRATKHRVKNSPTKTRFSAPFFHQPSAETIIAPLDIKLPSDFEPSDTSSPPSPFQFGKYVYGKFKASYAHAEPSVKKPE